MSKRKRTTSKTERPIKKQKISNDGCPVALHTLEQVQTENYILCLTAVSLKDDVVTIINKTSAEVSLAGWLLKSATGKQEFTFPEDCVLKAGSTLSIWSGEKNSNKKDGSPGSLFWTKKYIWKDAGDTAVLYDAEGNAVDKLEVVGAGKSKPVLAIQKLDIKRQCISVINRSGAEQDLAGFFIRTLRLNTFSFPEGCVLKAGEAVTVWTSEMNGDKAAPPESYFWEDHPGWGETEVCVLYDTEGNLVDQVTASLHLGEKARKDVKPKPSVVVVERSAPRARADYPECSIQ